MFDVNNFESISICNTSLKNPTKCLEFSHKCYTLVRKYIGKEWKRITLPGVDRVDLEARGVWVCYKKLV